MDGRGLISPNVIGMALQPQVVTIDRLPFSGRGFTTSSVLEERGLRQPLEFGSE